MLGWRVVETLSVPSTRVEGDAVAILLFMTVVKPVIKRGNV